MHAVHSGGFRFGGGFRYTYLNQSQLRMISRIYEWSILYTFFQSGATWKALDYNQSKTVIVLGVILNTSGKASREREYSL